MLYFTLIWGDKLYRIKLTEKGAQNVHICVHFTVNLLLRARNLKFGTKDAYVTAIRPEKGFCEIRLFRPPYTPKTSKNPENRAFLVIFFLSAVSVQYL